MKDPRQNRKNKEECNKSIQSDGNLSKVLKRRFDDYSPRLGFSSVELEYILQELNDLGVRTAVRLRSSYRVQLGMTIATGLIFVAIIIWSLIMVSQKEIGYNVLFGSSGIVTTILVYLKWQPFERVNRARKLADQADTLATGFRLAIRTIYENEDPERRIKALWDTISKYLTLLQGLYISDIIDGMKDSIKKLDVRHLQQYNTMYGNNIVQHKRARIPIKQLVHESRIKSHRQTRRNGIHRIREKNK